MEKDIQRINVYTAIEQMKRLSQEGETFSLSFRKYDRQRHSGGDTVRLNHARLRPKASDEEIDELEEASALKDISHMPARVKCAVLGWHTLEEMLNDEV